MDDKSCYDVVVAIMCSIGSYFRLHNFLFYHSLLT